MEIFSGYWKRHVCILFKYRCGRNEHKCNIASAYLCQNKTRSRPQIGVNSRKEITQFDIKERGFDVDFNNISTR